MIFLVLGWTVLFSASVIILTMIIITMCCVCLETLFECYNKGNPITVL